MSRAFVKEDDGERGNAVADIQFREAKLEWLRIQKSKKVKPELLARWIKDTEADIAKTKRELGYEG